MIKEKLFSYFRAMPVSSIMFIIFFLLKPFYLFPSGSIQPGDAFLLLSFIAYIIEGKPLLHKKDILFIVFVAFVLLINTCYFFRYGELQFIKSCLYYIFNCFSIIVFRDAINRNAFQMLLSATCKINLIFQLILFLFRIGSYWEGTYRYMGSYNDPNQLGFAIISTLCIMRLLNSKHWYFYAAISFYLITKTYSGGMFVTLALLCSLDVLLNFNINKNCRYSRSQIIVIFCIIFFIVAYLIMNPPHSSLNLGGFRIKEKLSSSSSIIESFVSDRNLMISVEHPEYFIIGYGEALSFRRYGRAGEMHSTWLSLCFCYGILPFTILIRWVYNNVRKIDKKYAAVYIAMFLEAFTLVNHRQPSFWMIIVLGNLCKIEHINNREGLNVEKRKN